MKTLNITSIFRKYSIDFITDLKRQIKIINQDYKAHYLIDKNMLHSYKSQLSDIKTNLSYYPFEAIENNKTLESVIKYVKFLLEKSTKKTCHCCYRWWVSARHWFFYCSYT